MPAFQLCTLQRFTSRVSSSLALAGATFTEIEASFPQELIPGRHFIRSDKFMIVISRV